MGPFHKRLKKTKSYAIQIGAVSSHFFQLLFDTATLSILKLRMLKATGCKQRLKSDLLHRILYAYTFHSSIKHSTAPQ